MSQLRSVSRRNVVTFTGSGALIAVLGACSSGSTSAPGKSTAKATETPSSGLSAEVVGRIEDSQIPGELWKDPKLHGVSASRVIAVGDVPSGTLTGCADLAQSSALAVEAITAIRPTEKYLVLLPAGEAEFDRWAENGTRDLAGVFLPSPAPGSSGWVAIDLGRSIAPGYKMMDDLAYTDAVIRHELFHANTLSGVLGHGNAPKWVTEGFAEWAGSTATVVFPQKAPPAILPTDDSEFAKDQTTNAYARSFMFVSYLVSRFGQKAAMSFYNRSREPAYGSTAASFQHVFGHALSVVERDWAAQYKKQVSALKVDVWEQ